MTRTSRHTGSVLTPIALLALIGAIVYHSDPTAHVTPKPSSLNQPELAADLAELLEREI